MTEILAEAVARTMAARGIVRMFGVPGGGSSLDLIDAGARHGIEFVLCRGETAAAIMAAVSGEITGVPGVVLTGIGPGAASAANGIAYASLERAPVILVTDASEDGAVAPPHQIFDQQAMYAPVTKGQRRLNPETGAAAIGELLDLALAEPRGPVQIDLSAADAGSAVTTEQPVASAPPPAAPLDGASVERALALITGARRPALIAGLQARDPAGAAATVQLAEALGGPAMTTYKARGVIPDGHPLALGAFTNAKLDHAVLSSADLFVLCGVDPVEMIPGRWPHEAPAIVLTRSPGLAWPFAPAAEIVGHIESAAPALAEAAGPADWKSGEIAALRERIRATLALPGDGHTAETLVDAVRAAVPDGARLAVDAGAHMFSAMTRWPARAPHDILKSNGLSTMGFAVPAAIAAWLCDPARPAVALTGDGGMMMCLAELSTAARLGANLTVVVVNDSALSLIDIKQQRQQRPPLGVRYPQVDFAAAARGLGCRAWTVGRHEPLDHVLEEAFAADGPTLVDVTVDPSGYRDQLAALRG